MPEPTPPNRESPHDQAAPPEASTQALPVSRSKKRAVTFIVTLGVLAVLLIILNLIPFDRLSEEITKESETTELTYDPIFFDTPVADEDFSADNAYMDLDRYLHYTALSGETFLVNGDAGKYGAVCELFNAYCQAVISGDCDAYNALFTDEYIEKKGAASFTPQKLYNIRVKEMSSTLLTDGDANGLYKGATVTNCQVNYCIKDNNGTFRNDFYREGDSRTQIFEILDYNGSVRISQVSTPKYVTQNQTEPEKEGLPIMFFVWIALIVLAIVAEAMSTALVAIWFVPAGIVSMILALAEVNIYAQVITYVVLALASLIVFKVLEKKFHKKKGYTPTNADRIVGGKGIVTEEINNLTSSGEVKIDGKRWSARTEEDGEIIAAGELVTVLRIEGVKLICAPCKSAAE